MTKYRKQAVKITDTRVRMMNEVLTCVKLIKMYAWEDSFADSISEFLWLYILVPCVFFWHLQTV